MLIHLCGVVFSFRVNWCSDIELEGRVVVSIAFEAVMMRAGKAVIVVSFSSHSQTILTLIGRVVVSIDREAWMMRV